MREKKRPETNDDSSNTSPVQHFTLQPSHLSLGAHADDEIYAKALYSQRLVNGLVENRLSGISKRQQSFLFPPSVILIKMYFTPDALKSNIDRKTSALVASVRGTDTKSLQ